MHCFPDLIILNQFCKVSALFPFTLRPIEQPTMREYRDSERLTTVQQFWSVYHHHQHPAGCNDTFLVPCSRGLSIWVGRANNNNNNDVMMAMLLLDLTIRGHYQQMCHLSINILLYWNYHKSQPIPYKYATRLLFGLQLIHVNPTNNLCLSW